MSKAPPPLLGFNNNVRHRGRIFHIQTEDSGVKFPRIVTHLFADGGRIVKTTRTDYSQHLQKTDMAAVVRGMMKEQHKAMFAALRAGDMDALLEKACGPLEEPKSKAPESKVSLDPTSRNDLETARVVLAPVLTEPPVSASTPSAKLTVAAPVPAPTEAPPAEALRIAEGAKLPVDSEEPSRSRRPLANPNLRRPTPSVTPPEAAAFDLDVASLDKNPPRSSRAPSVSSARSPRSSGLPPRKSRPPIPARPSSGTQPVAAAVTADAAAASLGRPQTRLAAAPATNARSIFGDGAISEQSLDEVILSYLAEDLEETK